MEEPGLGTQQALIGNRPRPQAGPFPVRLSISGCEGPQASGAWQRDVAQARGRGAPRGGPFLQAWLLISTTQLPPGMGCRAFFLGPHTPRKGSPSHPRCLAIPSFHGEQTSRLKPFLRTGFSLILVQNELPGMSAFRSLAAGPRPGGAEPAWMETAPRLPGWVQGPLRQPLPASRRDSPSP